MTAGIVSFGAYIPMYRLGLKTIGEVWGKPASNRERAVANCDEDSLTMGVESVIDCVRGFDRQSIDGLCFATTTPAYREKQNASIIAKVVDLPKSTEVLDIANSIRGGSSALRCAMHAVNSGAAKSFLVVASDCRVPAPDSEFEFSLGDGSAAFLVGDSDIAAEIEGYYGISSEFLDIWRREEDKYIHTWEERFVATHGYLEHTAAAVSGLFAQSGLAAKDFTKAIFYAWDERRHAELARKLGFDYGTQVQDPLLTSVGNTGTASAPMMLVAALENAKPGDRILFVGYGDGADAFALRVTDRIERLRNRRGIRKHLASKMNLVNYGRYLRFRNLLEHEVSRELPPYGSLTHSWRDSDWVLSCKGHKCRHCGTIHIPPQRVCAVCQTTDDFEVTNLSDKKGKLFTYSLDYLTTVTPDPPNVIAVVDLEGGGRFYTTMTDRDPEKLSPEMEVELTFRKLHEGQAMHNYFWRARPVRT